MSKAFTREDVDPPERSGRVRSAAGLPPGAVNYISARGARRLHDELSRARSRADDPARVAELEDVLNSVTIVDRPERPSNEVTFGSTVTLETMEGRTQTFTVVGVDELNFEPDGISWVSPIGKSLLSAEAGDRVTVGDERLGRIVKVEYRD